MHRRIGFNGVKLGHFYGARFGDPRDVITQQINYHQIFCAVLPEAASALAIARSSTGSGWRGAVPFIGRADICPSASSEKNSSGEREITSI